MNTLAAIVVFVGGLVVGIYIARATLLLRIITKELKQISINTKKDSGVAQTLRPINKPVETEHLVRSYNPKQVAAEVQRKFEERNTL